MSMAEVIELTRRTLQVAFIVCAPDSGGSHDRQRPDQPCAGIDVDAGRNALDGPPTGCRRRFRFLADALDDAQARGVHDFAVRRFSPFFSMRLLG